MPESAEFRAGQVLVHLLILVHLSTGCGTTREIGIPPDLWEQGILFDGLVGNEVTIVTAEHEVRGIVVSVHRDSLMFHPRGSPAVSLPLSSIVQIQAPLPAGEYVIGAIFGGIAGGAIGVAVAKEQPTEGFESVGSTMGSGLVGCATGCVLGLGATAACSYENHDIYVFVSRDSLSLDSQW